MYIALPFLYLAMCLLHAWYHWYKIEKENKILTSKRKIWEWGLISFVLFICLITIYDPLPLIIFPIVTRLAHFDIALNLMRGKKWDYEGQISKRKSWVDWIEYKIGLPIAVLRIVYLITYFSYLFLYFLYAN
jgi:hypothetical protein